MIISFRGEVLAINENLTVNAMTTYQPFRLGLLIISGFEHMWSEDFAA
jgi:hypothetical protein